MKKLNTTSFRVTKALKTIKVDAGAEEALVEELYGISASVNVTTE